MTLDLRGVDDVAKHLFEGAERVSSYFGENDLCVHAEYRIDIRAIDRAARRSDAALVDMLVERFGSKATRARTADAIRVERLRPFSLRAGRRSGKHKRLP
jgi:hypothetical protein